MPNFRTGSRSLERVRAKHAAGSMDAVGAVLALKLHRDSFMAQKIADASLLGLFGLMYTCAVFLLRFRKAA